MIKLCFLLFPILLITCDKAAFISINSKYEKFIFQCGEIEIKAHSTKAIYFDFKINFKTNNPFKIHPKNLEITHLGEKVPYDVYYDKKKLIQDDINITKDDQMILEFSLLGNPKGTHNMPGKVGDTIFIKANDFLICDGKQIIKEPIILVIDKIN